MPSDAQGAASAVELLLPAALAEAAGGSRSLVFRPGSPGHSAGTAGGAGAGGVGAGGDRAPTIGVLLELLRDRHPGVYRRIVDDAGDIRRHVNLYVDGDDIRDLAGSSTVLGPGAVVLVLQSIAGG
ncbi:MoaD/ThiS family protein [Arthrobacter zhangbolii]|uniref:MoaD/ThiS family protein n=1 Tax=Arthrobacter zhangbolii TaxID=2886936 RepID=A0A9X1S8L9_9MICC|nr:MoaD/ThiS family protein [Arthrobacter zhangbolii]MCC3272083.1 MoaD/ThiS family protein [Arthrobacter zhangbolii]MCC3294435.1 MoaD/ThiS family protein [Arthrobacter zhangbolii]UON92042.1 MoaD/ThiS family protein [Arthrobacter zhangbolii]